MSSFGNMIKAGAPGSRQACYSPYGPRRCYLESGHPGDHVYADEEACDECCGTRWPLSEHEDWCSLREEDEYTPELLDPVPEPDLTLWTQAALAHLVQPT